MTTRRTLFIAILAVGIALRIYRIDYQSFWNDEVLTVFNTNLPLAQVIANPNDINILPLYYLTIYPFLKFGNAEFWLRFPSAFLGILSLALLFFILKEWLGEKLALVGALLFSLSPFHIWYSQEARPYALLVFLGLLAMWLFQKVESQPDRPAPLVALVFATVSTLYCHTVAIPFVGMIGLFLLVGAWKSKRKAWFGAVAGIAVLSLPALYRLLVVPPVGSANPYQEFNPLSLAYTAWAFTTGYSLILDLTQLHLPQRMAILKQHLYMIVPLMGLVSGLTLRGLFKLYRENRAVWFYLAAWLVFPLAFAVVGSLFTVHPFNVRYAILSFPPFVMFLVAGIFWLRNRWLRWGSVVAISTVSVVSLFNYYYVDRFSREDNRSAGEYLSQHAQPGDLVIASAAYTARNVRYYYHGPHSIEVRGYPTDEHAHNGLTDKAAGALFVHEDHVALDLSNMIAGRDHFWLFLSRTYHSDPEGYILHYCDSHFRREVTRSWSGVKLILFRRQDSS